MAEFNAHNLRLISVDWSRSVLWSKAADRGVLRVCSSDLPLPCCLDSVNLSHFAWAKAVRWRGVWRLLQGGWSWSPSRHCTIWRAETMLFSWNVTAYHSYFLIITVFKKVGGVATACFTSAACESVHVNRGSLYPSFPRLPIQQHPQFIIAIVLLLSSVSCLITLTPKSSLLPD